MCQSVHARPGGHDAAHRNPVIAGPGGPPGRRAGGCLILRQQHAGCDTGAWRAAPVSVTRQAATSAAPVITTIKTAAHPECGYDRLVLGITGPMPGYDIRYVTRVTADPSGEPIAMVGRSFLLITLRPAQAHDGSGAPTVTRPKQTLGYPVLKSYALAGDFEGVVTLALGMHDTTSIRVGEFPGLLYIDVRALPGRLRTLRCARGTTLI
ncbi:MAG: AMIN-like domain-containing (lipo)protein [Streptosporangiaceae bacterium]